MGVLLGNGLIQKEKEFHYAPDDAKSVNPHLMITGVSGAGKTQKILDIATKLHEEDPSKVIIIIDFHGDMYIPGENHIEYTLRNSEYGVNVFEFETDEKNGGPAANVLNIVQMFKKNFWPQMGALQEGVLKSLLISTYRYKGIFDEKHQTWPDERDPKGLPIMKDLYTVFTMIKNLQGNQDDIGKHFIALLNDVYTYRQKANTTSSEKTKERHENSIKERQATIEEVYEKFHSYVFENKGTDVMSDDEVNDYNIDLTPYENKKTRSVLENLEPYIRDFSEADIFNKPSPTLRRGINRFDISGFTNMAKPDMALFFADITIQKIFRRAKMNGVVSLETHGKKTTMFVVMDESRIVLPSGRDKSNPYHILNKISLESRKYGLGLILGSQRVAHFSGELLTSFYTKIILRTDAADVKITADALGIQKRDMGYFETIDKKQGAGLLVQASKVTPIVIWTPAE